MTKSNLERFSNLLSQSGWTKAEAAKRLKVTPSAIYHYLSGNSKPSETLLQLMEILVEQEVESRSSSAPAVLEERYSDDLAMWEQNFINELRRMPEDAARRFASNASSMAAELADALEQMRPSARLESRRQEIRTRLDAEKKS